MEDCSENLTEVKVNTIHSCLTEPVIPSPKVARCGETNFTFHKSMLAIANQILVLHLPEQGFWGDSLHSLDRGDGKQVRLTSLEFPQIFLLAALRNVCNICLFTEIRNFP